MVGTLPATIPCAPCRWQNSIITSLATNEDYLNHALELAQSVVAARVSSCVCVVLSSAVSSHSDNLALRELRLPWSSTWRPPGRWCAQKLSGWRHAGILKTHALYHLLSAGWDVFFVDTDWRFVANPLPGIVGLGRDVVAARDQTRHMLNIGVLWVRASQHTVQMAWRSLNRTLQAWDQAVSESLPSALVPSPNALLRCPHPAIIQSSHAVTSSGPLACSLIALFPP
jgi:hypothetical protein